jgi:hypothetical protein
MKMEWETVPKHQHRITNLHCIRSQKNTNPICPAAEAWNHASGVVRQVMLGSVLHQCTVLGKVPYRCIPWSTWGWWYSSTYSEPQHMLGWWVKFMLQLLYPSGKDCGTHWIWGWVGPRASLDILAKRSMSTLLGFLGCLSHSIVIADYAVLAPHVA